MAPEWIAWNLLLATVPAVLAGLLFRPGRRPSPGWWVGAVAFAVFLPNAPYVLTDVIHFADEVRATDSDLRVAFVLIPKYAAFFVAGFTCYAFALHRMERWLRGAGWSLPRVLGVDVTVHALCAVGVFLGRVFRFNSWDLLARPGEVAAVVRFPKASTVVFLVLTFLVLAGGSAVVRSLAAIRHRIVLAR